MPLYKSANDDAIPTNPAKSQLNVMLSNRLLGEVCGNDTKGEIHSRA